MKPQKKGLVIGSILIILIVVIVFGLNYFQTKHLDKGWNYLNNNQYQMAISEFNLEKEKNSDQYWVYAGLGKAYELLGDFEEAQYNYKKAIDLDSTIDYSYRGLGNISLNMGEYDLAQEYAEEAIKRQDFSHSKNYLLLGQVFFKKGNYERAQEEFKKAIEIEPGVDSGYIGFGFNVLHSEKCYLKGECSLATNAFKIALTLNPNSAYSHYGLGHSYTLQNESLDLALKEITTAIEMDGSNPYFYIGLGQTYFLLANYKDAKIAYLKAEELIGNHQDGRINGGLGRTYYALGDYENAEKYLGRYYLDKPHVRNFELHARALYKLGRIEEANTQFAYLAENYPDYDVSDREQDIKDN